MKILMVLEREFPPDERVEKEVLSHLKYICFLKSNTNIGL